jgi:hypothetical protein
MKKIIKIGLVLPATFLIYLESQKAIRDSIRSTKIVSINGQCDVHVHTI